MPADATPELTPNHFVNLANGRFSSTSRQDMADLFRNYQRDGGERPLLVHFHGGLVKEAAGMGIARELLPQYWKAGAYPVFFVWEAGLWEVVSRNLPEIFQERIFNRILRRAMQFVLGKAREGASEGAKGLALEIPDERDVRDELRRAEAGETPYAGLEAGVAAAGDLTPEQERQIRDAVEGDPVIQEQAAAITAGPGAGAKGADVGAEGAVPTLMSPEVLEEMRGPGVDGGKGLVSSARIATGVVRVVSRVVKRAIKGRDHGLYTTVVEEVLREFYLAHAGGFVWSQMKKDAHDAFQDPADTFGGTAFIDELVEVVRGGARPRVVLVGHSTGAVYICELLRSADARLRAAEGDRPVAFDVVFLAPACTFQLLAETLAQVKHRIGNLRVFAMKDELESRDQLIRLEKVPQVAPILRALYPRSLLYFVSGVTEDEADMPLVGMQRYYGPRYGSGVVREVVDYLGGVRNCSVWSIAGEKKGMFCRAEHHGDFDSDPHTLESIAQIVAAGYGDGD